MLPSLCTTPPPDSVKAYLATAAHQSGIPTSKNALLEFCHAIPGKCSTSPFKLVKSCAQSTIHTTKITTAAPATPLIRCGTHKTKPVSFPTALREPNGIPIWTNACQLTVFARLGSTTTSHLLHVWLSALSSRPTIQQARPVSAPLNFQSGTAPFRPVWCQNVLTSWPTTHIWWSALLCMPHAIPGNTGTSPPKNALVDVRSVTHTIQTMTAASASLQLPTSIKPVACAKFHLATAPASGMPFWVFVSSSMEIVIHGSGTTSLVISASPCVRSIRHTSWPITPVPAMLPILTSIKLPSNAKLPSAPSACNGPLSSTDVSVRQVSSLTPHPLFANQSASKGSSSTTA